MDRATAAAEALLARLLPALAAQLRPAGGLHDPLLDAPTPPDHYGNLSTALALSAAGQAAAATIALDAWLATPAEKLGHLPFNRLLLLLLRQLQTDDAALAPKLAAGLARCPLRPPYPSNNWSLLAAATQVLETGGDSQERIEARDEFLALLQRWTTADGGFIDFPARPAGHVATPQAYHHKALFLTALLARLDGDAALAAQARRLLDWAARYWDAAALAGGLGRSSHALFGDGCLLAALLLLAPRCDGPAPAAALATRLASQFRADGLLWLTPAGAWAADAGWDNYMHLSVYNAWTAGVVAFALHLSKHTEAPAALREIQWQGGQRPARFHDEAAGLLCLRSASGASLTLGTRGQLPQAFSLNEAELRYAGAQPFHFVSADGQPLLPPPLRRPLAELLAQPALAGWTPLFRAGGRLYALSDFDEVTIEPQAEGCRVVLDGSARALTRRPPDTAWRRLVAAFDWRFLSGRLGRSESLRRQRLPGLKGRLVMELGLAPPRISRELQLEVSAQGAIEYLNPQGHALMADAGWQLAEAEPHAPADQSWQECALPATLPGGLGRCLPRRRLAAGTHRWRLALALPPSPDQ